MSESAAVGRPNRSIGFAAQSWRADASQLHEIRDELRRWLAHFGLRADAVDDVVLAANEAVSNAIDHAYSPATAGDTVDIILRAESDSLLIEVVDHGRWRTPSPGPIRRGWGIAMMSRLMDSVIIHDGPQGTRVVLRYALEPT